VAHGLDRPEGAFSSASRCRLAGFVVRNGLQRTSRWRTIGMRNRDGVTPLETAHKADYTHMNAMQHECFLSRAIVCGLILLTTLSPTALAISWERISGLSTQRESHRGVAAVQFCAGGGHIAVGSQIPITGSPPNAHLLAERLDPNGNPGWRYTYDSGSAEQAAEVVEYTDGSGFAILGTIDPAGTPAISRLTISKIDCSGNMLWQRGYGPVAGVNAAWDLIRANTGDGITTFPGDLIALGEFTPNGGSTRVLLLRIRSNGALIWMREYATPTALPLYGRGVAEVETPAIADDIVVAGGAGSRAAFFQVKGDNGAAVCGAQLPGLGYARFNDIARHGSGAGTVAPGFTLVGETQPAPFPPRQIFVASYRSSGCALQRQIQWGSSTDDETAQAVTTTRTGTFNSVAAGQLLIVGNVTGPYGSATASVDAWAHLMVPVGLTPYTAGGYIGQRYGTQRVGLSGAESALAVAEGATDAYIAGSSSSPWTGVDPLHALTMRISFNFMKTQCSASWSAPTSVLSLTSALTTTSTVNGQVAGLIPPLRAPLTTHAYCCGTGP
jgi:hypothetical protein